MLWLGPQIGLSAYNHDLASSANGTVFSSSLTLGATSALAFWPMLTAIVILIAEWGTRPTPSPPPPAPTPRNNSKKTTRIPNGPVASPLSPTLPPPTRPPSPPAPSCAEAPLPVAGPFLRSPPLPRSAPTALSRPSREITARSGPRRGRAVAGGGEPGDWVSVAANIAGTDTQ